MNVHSINFKQNKMGQIVKITLLLLLTLSG